MKKAIAKNVFICDECQEREVDYPPNSECFRCHKIFCYECKDKRAVEYKHSVWFSGSGDGLYCVKCDDYLAHYPGEDKLFDAYVAILHLRNEEAEWAKTFKIKAQSVEDVLKRLHNLFSREQRKRFYPDGK